MPVLTLVAFSPGLASFVRLSFRDRDHTPKEVKMHLVQMLQLIDEETVFLTCLKLASLLMSCGKTLVL